MLAGESLCTCDQAHVLRVDFIQPISYIQRLNLSCKGVAWQLRSERASCMSVAAALMFLLGCAHEVAM